MTNYDKIKQMNKEDIIKLINTNKCQMCNYTHAKTLGDCNNNCEKGIKLWLDEEVEITDDDIDWEYREFCDGFCSGCKYENAKHNCKINWFMDNFNMVDGKITRRR